MFTRIFAILFGIGFIFIGVAGFIPSFVTDNQLFGFFEVDAMHNIVHIVTGVLAIMASTSLAFTKIYFEIAGAIYAIAGIWGFWSGGDLFIMHVNTADNILHLIVGVIALYLGFSVKKEQP